MKKIVAAVIMLAASGAVYAGCTYSNYTINGKFVSCSTCCYGSSCNTTCN